LCSPYRCVERDGRVRVVVGWVLIEALMWTLVGEMALVGAEHRTGVALVIDQYPVGALGPDSSDKPFRIAVRAGRLRWRLDDLDVLSGVFSQW
jgi:hypothetical protein